MKKWTIFIGTTILIFMLSSCRLVAWEPGHGSNEEFKEEVSAAGGVISIEDSTIRGFSIEIPKDAYTETVEFLISTEDFNPITPKEGFHPVSPLIVVDNGHVRSEKGLTVRIPISVDSEQEFVMAFYYDTETDMYEAIPTLSYNDEEIVILTTHFSKIIVSSIPIDELEEDLKSNPALYDTGFVPGEDDLPVSNSGTELEVLGHCAGQTAFMAYYYMEHKLKNNEEDLYTRFDMDTPFFKTDDIAIEQLASAIQSSINWKSSVYKELENALKESDLDRFYAFAYAIKITKSPQYMEIRDYTSNPETGKPHAILAYKIAYEEEQFKVFVADPNFPGEARYVSFDKEDGFGVYRSGINASEAANNDRGYSTFFFAGTYAIVDKVLIESLYHKMINQTLAEQMFSSYVYMYLVAKDGQYTYVPLVDDSVVSPVAYGGEPTRMKVLIAVSNSDFKAIFFRDQKTVYPYPVESELIDGANYIKYTMLLGEGQTNLGISTFRLVESVGGDDTWKEWGKSQYYSVKVDYNPYDYSSYTSQIEGTYKELARGSGVSDWPSDRTITFNSDGTGSVSWDNDSGKAEDTYWIIKEVDGKKVVEMAIKGTYFYEEYAYNSLTNEITINPGTDYYITYQKKVEEDFTYTISYLSSIEDSVWIYSPCPEVLNLDKAWGQAIMNSFSTKRLFFTVESEDESFNVKLRSDLGLVNGQVIDGKWTVSAFLEGGKTYTLVIQIYHGSVVVKEISITVNTTDW
jgi:hypothetical protein